MKRLLTVFALFVALQATLISQSETLVNKTWEHAFGAPNDYEWASSILDNAGNLITTGHTTLDATNTELLLIKQDPDGNVLWQQAFQAAQNTKNGGVALAVDANDNIYVAGVTSTTGSLNDFNFLVLKYNSSGTKIWHQTFNGTGSGTDVQTGIIANSTRVYVCGTSKGSTTNMDYWALRLTASNGSIEWQKRYDYAGLDDIPANMAVDASGNVVLTGSSAASALNWEVATVKYGSSNGSLLNENRVPNDGSLGLTKPSAITTDGSGNFIITGIKTTNGTDFDIRTIKLSSSLGVVWVQDYDSGAKVDSVSAIVCDASGGIILTGWSSTQQSGSDILTLKYKADGTFGWARKRTVNPQDVLSKGRAVSIDANENIIIAGDLKGSMVVMQYDQAGELVWEKTFSPPSVISIRPLSISLNQNGEIFLTSISRGQNEKTYRTAKLNTFVRVYDTEYTAGNEPSHAAHEAIVNFDPSVINTDIIEDRDIVFGDLEDFISGPDLVSDIREKLRIDERETIKTIKIYKQTPHDECGLFHTSRLGREVKVPQFWTSLLLILPESVDLYQALDSLNNRASSDPFFPIIRYAGANLAVQYDAIVPNDEHYETNQPNLHPTTAFPNGHINVEAAWAAGAKGNPSTSIGVFDTGIFYSHEDFSTDGTFNGSKVLGGKDYTMDNNPPIQNFTNPDGDGHGTRCAGIAGAYRNNDEIGIAGIAGGDVDDEGNTGVSLYAMKVFPGNGAFTYIDAIVEGFEDGTNGEYPLDIMSNSWSITPNGALNNSYSIAELKKAVRNAFDNGITVVFSRGNSGNDEFSYPATYYPDWQTGDDWVISVGASNANGTKANFSNYGAQLDVIAPGTSDIVFTTDNVQDGYTNFSGTSASAPHVAGVAALLMGHHQTPLAPEDVEHLIQYGATDVGASGYDEQTGSGLLNAGNTLALLTEHNCRVVHYEAQPTQAPINMGYNVQCEMIGDYDIYPAGHQWMDIWKYTATVNHNLPPTAEILSDPGKPGYWVRNSGTNLWGAIVGGNLLPEPNAAFDGTPTEQSATLIGYHYGIRFVPGEPVIVPYSANPNGNCPETPTLAYSLLICDPEFTATGEIAPGLNRFEVFPNPATNALSIRYVLSETSDVRLSIFDLQGRVLTGLRLGDKSPGDYVFQMNTGQLATGMYICKLETNKATVQQKFVKAE
ncbi:MAG: T9SS type A sorting domain-containing protein [Saprospiraceae bacterium]|nr:MAG: T9SS type A sorting domain-containing protein [Saprospiraceae bacterium]